MNKYSWSEVLVQSRNKRFCKLMVQLASVAPSSGKFNPVLFAFLSCWQRIVSVKYKRGEVRILRPEQFSCF